jgi:uncharacterized protein YebE (UPF0316 family)
MESLATLPIWTLALFIFFLRIVDVSVGTIRTLTIVEGRIGLAMLLGFFEVLVWITVVAQVIARIRESPILFVAFAGGFAAGNAVGSMLERKLALGTAILRIISCSDGEAIAKAFRDAGESVTTFPGQGRDGPVTMIFTACPRRRVQHLIAKAHQLDPDFVYSVDRAGGWAHSRTVVGNPSGWRAFWKKK